jgi:DNA-binding NarL/FixJ family response regulator
MHQRTNDRLPKRISDEALSRIRERVASLHERNGSSVPHADLVCLSSEAGDNAILTIDFQAARSIGLPIVVLQTGNEGETDPRLLVLSPRELSVAKLIATGLANKEIARDLGLSIHTVKDHVHRILEKIGLPNRAAIAVASRGILAECS